MALVKSLSTPSGVSGEYLKITRVYANRVANTLSLSVSVYVDKDARLAGAEPLEVRNVEVDESQVASILEANNSLAAMYTYLKTLDDYSGASDDVDV